MSRLEGKRVLVTRAREQAASLCDALLRAGAVPVRFPTIEIQPTADFTPLDEALDRLDQYDWLGLTSVNAVRILWGRLHAGRGFPSELRVAAVGQSTAAALQEHGIRVDFIPDEFRGDELASGMRGGHRGRVLLLRAQDGNEALPRALTAAGVLVDDLPIYRTVQATPEPEALAALERGLDAATFTSASTVRHFCAIVGGNASRVLGGAVIACIGPLTAAAAWEAGLEVELVPAEHTVEGLVSALLEHDWPVTDVRSVG